MNSIPTLLLLSLCGCGSAAAAAPDLAPAAVQELTVLFVNNTDPQGVASARCPITHQIVGGGCKCDVSQYLWTSYPSEASGAYLCSCYGAGNKPVTATAICAALTASQAHADDRTRSAALESERAQIRAASARQRSE